MKQWSAASVEHIMQVTRVRMRAHVHVYLCAHASVRQGSAGCEKQVASACFCA